MLWGATLLCKTLLVLSVISQALAAVAYLFFIQSRSSCCSFAVPMVENMGSVCMVRFEGGV